MTEVIVPLAQVIVSPDDVDELGWQDQALCAQTDPEAFFPEKGGSTREAKRVCRSCEVRAECLEYALENDERFGIWSPEARGRLKPGSPQQPGRLNGAAWSADCAAPGHHAFTLLSTSGLCIFSAA